MTIFLYLLFTSSPLQAARLDLNSQEFQHLAARMSDRNKDMSVLKIEIRQNRNIKFFELGDIVDLHFKKLMKDGETCPYKVSVVTRLFLELQSQSKVCNEKLKRVRRGHMLVAVAPVLVKRMRQAMRTRSQLKREKADLLSQLEELNGFLWNYEKRRESLVRRFDKRVIEVQKERERALESIAARRAEDVKTRLELQTRLREIDAKVDFYQLHPADPTTDPWALNEDLGLPVARPQ